MMYTLMIRKADNKVVGCMSTRTTKENMLGNASPDLYDVVYSESAPSHGLIGAVVEAVDGVVTKLTPPAPKAPPPDPKTLYAAAKSDSERIAIIAQRMGLV